MIHTPQVFHFLVTLKSEAHKIRIIGVTILVIWCNLRDNLPMRADFDRVVVGAGLFGAYSALVLARKGLKVCLVEQGHEILGRASYVNQARLHTGLHYPRSLHTAIETKNYYEKFRIRYPSAIRDFQQIYAISRYNSKTNLNDFSNFISRLGIKVLEISPDIYFRKSSILGAFQVEEPTFDSLKLRKLFQDEIRSSPNIKVMLNSKVIGGAVDENDVELVLENGTVVVGAGLIIAAYAGINGIRSKLKLDVLPLTFEIADVHIVKVPQLLENLGFTVMDGPFWSLMPFGYTGFSSLTSVGLTPLAKSRNFPRFSCQNLRQDCSPSGLANCSTCSVRPKSNLEHISMQVALHLKDFNGFEPKQRLTTVKTILTSSEVDDSRPTVIKKEVSSNVWTIFSGKVTTLFDVEEGLS